MRLNLVPSKRLFPLMAILFAVAIVFTLAEITLRIKVKTRCNIDPSLKGIQVKNLQELLCMDSNPYLGYQMPKDLDVYLVGESFKTNSLGFRTPEIKEKTRTRVLAIGDSVLAGWGVAENSDYLRLLESKMNKMGKEIEFINFGIPGYNAIQESVLLEKWFDEINPDFVIIHYTANDWEEVDNGKRKPHFSSSSYFLNYLVLNTQKFINILPKNQRIEIAPHSFKQDTPENLGEAYDKMRVFLKNKKTPSLVILGSRYESPVAPHIGVLSIMATLNFNTVDLMKIMRGKHVGIPNQSRMINDRHNNELIIEGDGHPNQQWHEEVSEILLPILTKELF